MADSAHKRLVKNTFALYIRMFIIMGVSIYTTRVVLNALGVSDYGIYNIVGGVVAFMTMITGALTISVQRFLNYEIGKTENGNVSGILSAAIIIHLILALILFVGLETIGSFYFDTSINIPEDRFNAAKIVFQFSALASCITLITSPFSALIVAYERMDIFAGLSIVDALLKLGVVYILLAFDYDRLVAYGALMLAEMVIYAFINIFIWRFKFSHVKFSLKFHKNLFFKISSFASWSAFGQVAWAFTLQGVNILLNIFFGSILNAAYGVTSQVHNAVTKFVQSFQTAVNPQLIKKYAQQDKDEVILLLLNGTKFSCYLLFLIAIPIFIEMENILGLWLKEVPEYTLIFCRLMLINIVLDTLSNLFATAAQAYGKIRNYQLIVSLVLIMNFPLSYLALSVFKIPYLTYVVYGFISICLLVTRIIIISGQIERRLFKPFINKVLIPVTLVLIPSFAISYLLYLLIDNMADVAQLIVFVLISVIMISGVIFGLGLNSPERNRVIVFVKSKVSRK